MNEIKKRVLIVDDDLPIVEVIKIILEEKNYLVDTLTESQSIKEKLSLDLPDLILLDIWMSGLDGVEITRILKSSPRTKHIPIIMISANNEVEKIAKNSGADDFIAKPFDVDVLIKKVEKHVRINPDLFPTAE